MQMGFEKIIAFIRRTGDRCVVLDAAGNPAYVVLPLEEYEQLALRTVAVRGRENALVAELDQQVFSPAEGPSSDAVLPPSGAHSESDQYYFEPIE